MIVVITAGIILAGFAIGIIIDAINKSKETCDKCGHRQLVTFSTRVRKKTDFQTIIEWKCRKCGHYNYYRTYDEPRSINDGDDGRGMTGM
jgi:hypothetical protein